ncbi:MAG TPA: signal peptidase I [Candidatus Saccharimonadales bacterium]|nr:signal peptidase I [Candidatus Saccharimonadales bacterium]
MSKDQKDFLYEMLETFVVSLIIIFTIYKFIAFPTLVWGASMEPNFHTGERVLVERISHYFRGFQRGDVVVLHPPEDDSLEYIKRVIALPGDIVKIIDCNVYITRDGQHYMLEETYLSKNTCTMGGTYIREGRSLRIDEGKYMVLGDNREKSADSRIIGLIDSNRILGKVVFRFWPVSKAGFI